MTNQTIPVPVDLARRLIASFPAHSAVAELKALIPSPPKVGDTLTAVGVKAAALPEQSVLIDSDGDVWITSGGGSVYLSEYGANDRTNPATIYEPYLLVHIGRD